MNAERPNAPGLLPGANLGSVLIKPRLAGRRSPLFAQMAQCLLVGMLAYGSYWVISQFFLQSVEVVGTSMTPTLHPAERYLLNRWTYFVRDPAPNDIVVIRDPLDNTLAVKRIVAGAGDCICLKRGRVYVNGRELWEPYLPTGTLTFPYTRMLEQPLRCGAGQYVVLGDNRNNSADSRTYGPVPRQNILGVISH